MIVELDPEDLPGPGDGPRELNVLRARFQVAAREALCARAAETRKDLGPNLVEQATSAVTRQAFNRLYTLLGLLIAGVFTLLAALIAIVARQ